MHQRAACTRKQHTLLYVLFLLSSLLSRRQRPASARRVRTLQRVVYVPFRTQMGCYSTLLSHLVSMDIVSLQVGLLVTGRRGDVERARPSVTLGLRRASLNCCGRSVRSTREGGSAVGSCRICVEGRCAGTQRVRTGIYAGTEVHTLLECCFRMS